MKNGKKKRKRDWQVRNLSYVKNTKIECIVLLKDTVVAAASNSQISDEARSSMRSLLKSPIAPLPKYAGTYEDQIKSNQKLYFQYTLVIHIIKLQ